MTKIIISKNPALFGFVVAENDRCCSPTSLKGKDGAGVGGEEHVSNYSVFMEKTNSAVESSVSNWFYLEYFFCPQL